MTSCHKQGVVDETFENAFSKLLLEVESTIFDKTQSMSMSSLFKTFLSYLPEGVTHKYSIGRLRRQLELKYDKKIRIEKGKTGQGQSNLVISSSVSTYDAFRDRSLSTLGDMTCDTQVTLTVEQVLHRAANILKKEIAEIAIDPKSYADPSQVSIESSLQLVPISLRKFITWLIDEKSSSKVSETFTMGSKMRQCLAISECIVSLCKDALTPFHLAMALHVHHEFGSKQLVDLLYSHGFSASYTEVRRFLTSVSDAEISRRSADDYVPAGIIPIQKGGLIIQEGTDDVDINAETVDGKNTFHTMARVIFQERVVNSSLNNSLGTGGIARGTDRTLKQDQSSCTILQCLPFQKPQSKPQPPKYVDPIDSIMMCSSALQSVTDRAWVLLRAACRGILPDAITGPGMVSQTIPFWTGFNVSLSKRKDIYHAAIYEPVIDAKPSDLSTVFTAMKHCTSVSARAGQTFSIQTFDLQLYAVAQQVKWSHPNIFRSHVLRLGGFHVLSSFIAGIGKLWADGGLRDLLTDSGVYAGNTVEHMLHGKEFNRSTRALTLVYDALVTVQIQSCLSWCIENDRLTAIPAEVFESVKNLQQLYETDVHQEETFKEFEKSFSDFFDPVLQELFNFPSISILGYAVTGNTNHTLFYESRKRGKLASPSQGGV
ncbi:hypothetical protein FSP39_002876 [Pinctada imbricata]|uniref:Uncharacterized protein n=1 Tax=Pinctada imbricata TaxID=66713 RepID=A0AA89C416_PINIB|nr:hypothetical protein FSP39_002876 [Pinctada imbricata]